jgi:hypothetical protein
MSPLITLIILGVLLGTVVCIGAALLRKRGCAMMMLPFPLLVVAWFVFASIPPDAEREFDRLFGHASRPAVTNIRTIQPIFMDGYLISFRISEDNYIRITTDTFNHEHRGGLSFFGGARRPSSWPKILETMDMFDRCNIGEDYVLAYFDKESQTVYAAFHYWGW